MVLSRKFHWVKVNRDKTPDLPKQFSVRSYPSLITFGLKKEKVHRFQSYRKPDSFVEQLNEALRRHGLHVAGKEWDEPNPRPATICEAGTVETFPAPSEDVPSGIAFLKGEIWIAQGGKLRAIARKDAAVLRVFDCPASVRDLCTDGTRLYAMEYGWTAGKPIHVLDPATGEVLRSIVTKANEKTRSMGAAGVAWFNGKLHVLEGMHGRLNEVDPKTGAVTRRLDTGVRWLSGLEFDGRHFVAGSKEALFLLDPSTGKVVRKIPVNFPLRAVAARDGAYYLMEQPVFGHDKAHQRIRIWPKRTLIHKLTLKKGN